MSPRRRALPGAFTLVELLVVVAILSTLMVLAIPAFTNRKSADEITKAAYSIKAVLEQARGHAKANNTYTWVGFYEEDATASAPTNVAPPYPGKGRLVLATVASTDGTTTCQDTASSTANRIPLVASKIRQLGRLVKIDNIHLTDIGGPSSTTSSEAASVDDRPDFPYTWGAPDDYQNRISSDDAHAPFNQSLYPFVAQGYTFYKTIRFSPRGEANINSTYNLRRLGEIGLRPTHGTIVDTNSANVVAIQFSGITGDVKSVQKVKLFARSTLSFSLVELTLAIGVAAFCLIAIFGLLPIGVQSNQAAISQTAAASILSAVVSDLRATPGTSDTSPQFGLNFASPSQTLSFDEAGRATSIADGARYRLTIAFPVNPAGANAARFATLKISWPAAADPAVTQPAGSVETFAAFDRRP